eukprot:TRINITY_DN4180_c0_g1_i1.p1 TRINITY_DN4180_c0_g1~~TRINITY_DN4180_c0_g1_i1.p1  ORF type:complete len:467 (+),score=43.17 TRINITY_DN4180_c0_g1_i1:82-1401(+)
MCDNYVENPFKRTFCKGCGAKEDDHDCDEDAPAPPVKPAPKSAGIFRVTPVPPSAAEVSETPSASAIAKSSSSTEPEPSHLSASDPADPPKPPALSPPSTGAADEIESASVTATAADIGVPAEKKEAGCTAAPNNSDSTVSPGPVVPPSVTDLSAPVPKTQSVLTVAESVDRQPPLSEKPKPVSSQASAGDTPAEDADQLKAKEEEERRKKEWAAQQARIAKAGVSHASDRVSDRELKHLSGDTGYPHDAAINSVIRDFRSTFSLEEMRMFKGLFKHYDRDADGKLNVVEFHRLMEHLGDSKTHAELRAIIAEVTGQSERAQDLALSYRDFIRTIGGSEDEKFTFVSQLKLPEMKALKGRIAASKLAAKATFFEQQAHEAEMEKYRLAKIEEERQARRAANDARAQEERRLKDEEMRKVREEKDRRERLKARGAMFESK